MPTPILYSRPDFDIRLGNHANIPAPPAVDWPAPIGGPGSPPVTGDYTPTSSPRRDVLLIADPSQYDIKCTVSNFQREKIVINA
ncbi:hypothetical protein VTL71DRAFT_15946 [Oculimacula yallundae]|uniref:Uncharacterized protein n=1 Tax=Oculimacula yallundae TaxID=86028 RepID=A0ABR4CD39_9HELO